MSDAAVSDSRAYVNRVVFRLALFAVLILCALPIVTVSLIAGVAALHADKALFGPLRWLGGQVPFIACAALLVLLLRPAVRRSEAIGLPAWIVGAVLVVWVFADQRYVAGLTASPGLFAASSVHLLNSVPPLLVLAIVAMLLLGAFRVNAEANGGILRDRPLAAVVMAVLLAPSLVMGVFPLVTATFPVADHWILVALSSRHIALAAYQPLLEQAAALIAAASLTGLLLVDRYGWGRRPAPAD